MPLEFLQGLSITQNKIQTSSHVLQDLSWSHPHSPLLLTIFPLNATYSCSSAKGLAFYQTHQAQSHSGSFTCFSLPRTLLLQRFRGWLLLITKFSTRHVFRETSDLQTSYLLSSLFLLYSSRAHITISDYTMYRSSWLLSIFPYVKFCICLIHHCIP